MTSASVAILATHIRTLLASRYARAASDGVWHRFDGDRAFAYSDGDAAEDRIQAIVSSTSDLATGSEELMGHVSDWATLYHFSSARANLLRPLAGQLAGKVILEVGAGCGAITRYLGECGAHVTAVEGSARRASIAAARCRDLDRVAVVCDNLQDLALPARFDVVTLIGVLEYSRMFLDADDPVGALLRRCSDLLSDDGILIVAIENQLGLKYLAGAFEDHTAKQFFGVNDLYDARSPVTFGHQELRQVLRAAGFESCEFYAPFPDYKLPTVVVQGRAFEDPRLNVSAIVRSLPSPNQAFDYERSFAEELAWPVFIRNGLGLDVANSFLVRAAKSAAPQPVEVDGSRIWIFSTERRRCFAKEKIITAGADGVSVRGRRLYPDEPIPTGNFSQTLAVEEPYVPGELLAEGFYRIVGRSGWTLQQIAVHLRPWLEWLSRAAVAGHNGPAVPARYFDAIPRNVVAQSDGTFSPFDSEWRPEEDLPLAYLVNRGVLSLFVQCVSVAPPGDEMRRYVFGSEIRRSSLQEISNEVLALLGLTLDARRMHEYQALEVAFQHFVAGPAVAQAAHARSSPAIGVRRGSAQTLSLRELLQMSVERVWQRVGR